MKILIFSKNQLVRFLKENPIPEGKLFKTAFIRISSDSLIRLPFDDNDEFIKENVIEFNFCDIEEEFWSKNRNELLKAEKKEEEITGIRPRYSPITNEEAKEIVDFVNRQIEKGVKLLFIHCDAGVCRSGSVAYAIAKYILKDKNQAKKIFENQRYMISPTITSKIRNTMK